MLLLLLLALRGNAFLYQGEELGLPQGEVAFEHLMDPEAIANWPRTLGRDGARTPFPWQSSEPNAGFSTGEPWLPVDPAQQALAADTQDGAEGSTLELTRALTAIRKASPALRGGTMAFLPAPAGVLAFHRALEAERWLCVFNLLGTPVDLPGALRPQGEVVASAEGLSPAGSGLPEKLGAWSGFWARV